MTALKVATWELHNLVLRDGALQVRPSLLSLKAPTASTSFVAGFSVESPTTTEVFHYLFEQTAAGVVTLRVFTEEFVELFNQALGTITGAPVITYGLSLNQLMINSPSFSAPLYGIVGGGLVTATKTESDFPSDQPDSTAIAIPPGHICSFGDRLPIAQAHVLYFNDPAIDPRTYVGLNAIAFPGQIYDIFTGPDGALYLFTSQDAYVIPADALGHGQLVVPFVQTIPGVGTSRPRNAAASNGVVACLSRRGLVLVNSDREQVDLAPYEGARALSIPIEIDDYRALGQLFPTTSGFVLGFGAARPFYLVINLRDGFRSYVWMADGTALNVVGVLKSRDGDDLVVLRDGVVQQLGTGGDRGSNACTGVACGRVDSTGVARTLTVSADNVGAATSTAVGGSVHAKTTPTKPTDVVIGTSLWAATGAMPARTTRTTRHRMAVRSSSLQLEVGVTTPGSRLGACDLETNGQAKGRRDRS